MTRKIRVAAMLVTMAMATMAGFALASSCPPLDTCLVPPCPILIQNDANGKAYETSYNRTGFQSNAGSQLFVVGKAVSFGPPLSTYLNASDTTKEYTFVLSGLVSQGTLISTNGPSTIYDCNYDSTSGSPVFTIYEGSPRNTPSTSAQFAANLYGAGGSSVPSSFQDGTPILNGTLCGFHTTISKTGLIVNGSYRVNYRFTGGSLLSKVGDCTALLGGEWCVSTSCTPGPNGTGYSASPKGKWDGGQCTPVGNITWGRLKQIYR
jgi:hypothetical protein